MPYQDFLFQSVSEITGFQIDIDEHYGAGGGLHLLQLLSDGGYAYADNALNNPACSTGLGASLGSSSTTTSGAWANATVASAFPGTQATVLRANLATGTTSANSPAITFSPYVGWEGTYNLRFDFPGCTASNDCGSRTSVDVIVSPGPNQPTVTRTIAQTNGADASISVYNGTLARGASVVVRLAASVGTLTSPRIIVAEMMQLVASSTNGTITPLSLPSRGLYESSIAAGAFGDAVAAAAAVNVATAAVPNATAFDLFGRNLAAGAAVNAIASSSGRSGVVFIGGDVSVTINGTTSRGVAAFAGPSAGVAPVVANGGLAGVVNALVDLDGWLYAAGTFNATVDNAVSSLWGLARWQYSAAGSSWQAMGASSSFGVRSLSALSNNGKTLVVVGGSSAPALRVFDPSTSAWSTDVSAYVAGSVGAIATGDIGVVFGGRIAGASQYAAPGALSLGNSFQLEPLSFTVDPVAPAAATATPSATSKRALVSPVTSALLRMLMPRAPDLSGLSLPSSLYDQSTSPEILTAAFWTNGSTQVGILGGRFASASSGVALVGTYAQGVLSPLVGLNPQTVTGSVRALAVVGSMLLIGGDFSNLGGQHHFAAYDLGAGAFAGFQPPPISGASRES